jgi:hypothetical protein
VGKFFRDKSYFGQRAQASAPFELFVAVIIMSFVIVVGYQVLAEVKKQVCLNSVDKEMTNFKYNLEDTVNRKSSTKFLFNPEGDCFESKDTIMKIQTETNKKVCDARCGYPADVCFIMIFNNPKVAMSFKAKCVDLPQYTNFPVELCNSGGGDDLTTYTPIDPMNGNLLPGLYALRNISAAGETFPKVCVYYKP